MGPRARKRNLYTHLRRLLTLRIMCRGPFAGLQMSHWCKGLSGTPVQARGGSLAGCSVPVAARGTLFSYMREMAGALLALLSVAALAAKGASLPSCDAGAKKYSPCELHFEWNANELPRGKSPFRDELLNVEFRGPDKTTYLMRAFWDGGRSLRVRFTPNQSGTWAYRVTSEIKRLEVRESTFAVADTPSHGFITCCQCQALVDRRQAAAPVVVGGSALGRSLTTRPSAVMLTRASRMALPICAASCSLVWARTVPSPATASPISRISTNSTTACFMYRIKAWCST